MSATSLAGITVLDMTRYLPGGYTTQAFADLGADVIKIEEMSKGDFCRGDDPKIDGVSYYFTALCRNKRSLSLNLKTHEGKGIFKRLAKEADIVIENFRPGVMERLGIDYETIKNINPRIIYCSLTAYGQENPDSLKASHDINLQSLSGYLSLNGKRLTPLHLCDVATGMVAIQGVFLALFQRESTGKGQNVDVSMFDSFMWWMSLLYSRYHFQDSHVTEETLEYPAFCYNIYETKDKQQLAFGMVEANFWERFCLENNRPEFISKHMLRKHEDEEAWKHMEDFVAERTLAEWMDWLEGRDMCITPVKTIHEAVQDIIAKGSDMLAYNEYPRVGKVLQTGIPIRFSGEPASLKDSTPPPPLGADNRAVLEKAGFSRGEIERFIAMNVIGQQELT